MTKILIENFTKLDILIISHIFSWNRKKMIDIFFHGLSWMGDGYLYGALALVLFLLNNEFAHKILFAGLIAFGIEVPLHKVLKNLIKRERPHHKIENVSSLTAPPDKYSFPSGHAGAAFIIANIFSVCHPFMIWILFPWASLIGFSRIYLGVHYPTDVFAGILLGIICSLTGIWIIF